jgi:accessory gene regulator protein AgrB
MNEGIYVTFIFLKLALVVREISLVLGIQHLTLVYSATINFLFLRLYNQGHSYMRKYEQCVCIDFLFIIGVNWKSCELAVISASTQAQVI